MREMIRRARKLAVEEGRHLDTAHLLLAIVGTQGLTTAKRMLELHGLSSGRLRFPSGRQEQHGKVTAVLKKGFAYAASLKAEAEPLHLLASLCAVRGSLAHLAVEARGVDPSVIRTAALRCLAARLAAPPPQSTDANAPMDR